MKTASVALAAHLAGTVTTLATCWRVQRTDGVVLGFTDHNLDLVFGGVTYRAATGYQRAAVSSRADLSVDETELSGILNSTEITEADIRAGLYDGAQVRIFVLNHRDLSQGEIKLRKGRIGEIVVNDDGTYRAELRGLAQPLQQIVGEMYSAQCRADLGDTRCRIPLRPALRANSTAYAAGSFARVETNTGLVGSLREQGVIFECTTAGTSAGTPPTFSVTPGATTTDGTAVWTARTAWTRAMVVASSTAQVSIAATFADTLADGWFDGGVLVFETGLNAGIARDVIGWTQSGNLIELFLPMPYAIAPGDVFRIQPGCDKRLVTCRTKFSNRLNFRGEPHVPGSNAVIETPE